MAEKGVMMKKRLKFTAVLVVAGLLLCTTVPRVAEAGYYLSGNPAFFGGDSTVRSDGMKCWASSANFECEGIDQSVEVRSTINLRDSSTGEFTRRIYRSKDAVGRDAYAEIEYDLAYPDQEIYYIYSRHEGTWNGISMQDYTYDGI